MPLTLSQSVARLLLGDVQFAKPKSRCNSGTGTFFAVQIHIDVAAINAMVLRKCELTSLTFDCAFSKTIISLH